MLLGALFPHRFSRFLGRVTLLLLLVGVAGGGGALGFLLARVRKAEPLREFEDYSPNLTSRVLDRTGALTVAEFFIERRDFVPLDEIPPQLIKAFLAIEDERFYNHNGIDPQAVLLSAYANYQRGRTVRGASTITMQVARKTLESVGDEQNLDRKIREAIAALQIESRYPKDQILEFYLNQIPMGNGLWGVQAAANSYFGVGVQDLTLAQCATLAGTTALPEVYNPRDAKEREERGQNRHEPDDATFRRNLVLRNMLTLDFISEEEYTQAKSEPIDVQSVPDLTNSAPYFVDHVRRQIVSDPALGTNALFHEGTVIHSTVDLPLQALAERVLAAGLASLEVMWQSKKPLRRDLETENIGWRLREGQRRLVRIVQITPTGLILRHDEMIGDAPLPAQIPYFHPDKVLVPGQLIDVKIESVDSAQSTFRATLADDTHIQGALVVLDNHTGEILAMVGGADWYDEGNDGQWNRAILGGRQPGSCFKPFIYANAMEENWSPAAIIVDERVEYNAGAGKPPYVPRNYENVFFGPTTLVEALEHSRNVVTIRLTDRLGVNDVRDFTKQFDFTEDVSNWDVPPYVVLGLGVHDVTPLELSSAMTAFANDGVIIRPSAWREITDSRGKPIERTRPLPRSVMSAESAAQVRYMLERVVIAGTGQEHIGDPLLGLEGMPELAGKTGTTTNNIDGWFAGLTPDWSVVVFVGFDENINLGPEMTGGRVAGPIWRAFMREAMQLRPPLHLEFTDPPGMEYADICNQTGGLWVDSCADVDLYPNVPFKPGQAPTEVCWAGGAPSTAADPNLPPEEGGEYLDPAYDAETGASYYEEDPAQYMDDSTGYEQPAEYDDSAPAEYYEEGEEISYSDGEF